MSTFLNLGSLTGLKATEFRRLPDERGGGGLRRTLNVDLRGRSDWTRRAWAGTVYAADGAEVAAILAAANPDNDVNISGTAIGSTVIVRAQVTGDIPYIRSGNTWYFVVPLTVREV
jgi:hypothetical protein